MDYRCGIDVMREIIEDLFAEGEISKDHFDGYMTALDDFVRIFRVEDIETQFKMKILAFPQQDQLQ